MSSRVPFVLLLAKSESCGNEIKVHIDTYMCNVHCTCMYMYMYMYIICMYMYIVCMYAMYKHSGSPCVHKAGWCARQVMHIPC